MRTTLVAALISLTGSVGLADGHARPFTYVVPFQGGTLGAENVSYNAVVVLTNPTPTPAHFKVDAHFELEGATRDPRCRCMSCETETALEPYETTPVQFHSCGPLTAYILSSSSPIFVTNDVEEFADPGTGGRTGVSTIPIQSSLFPAGSSVIIPNVSIIRSGYDKGRANLVFFANSSESTTIVHIKMSRLLGIPNPPFVTEFSTTVSSNTLHIIPLPFFGPDLLAPYDATQVIVSSTAPYYVGASQIIGRHTAYRQAVPME